MCRERNKVPRTTSDNQRQLATLLPKPSNAEVAPTRAEALSLYPSEGRNSIPKSAASVVLPARRGGRKGPLTVQQRANWNNRAKVVM